MYVELMLYNDETMYHSPRKILKVPLSQYNPLLHPMEPFQIKYLNPVNLPMQNNISIDFLPDHRIQYLNPLSMLQNPYQTFAVTSNNLKQMVSSFFLNRKSFLQSL